MVLLSMLKMLTPALILSATYASPPPPCSNTSSISVPTSGQSSCSADSPSTHYRSGVLASIEHFCYDHANDSFGSTTGPINLHGSFFVDPNVTTHLAPIILGIGKPANSSCGNKVDALQCIIQFGNALDECNGNSTEVSSSSLFVDSTCGWTWEIDMSPRVPFLGDTEPGPAITGTNGTALSDKVADILECNKDGFFWPRQAINQGISDICKIMDGKFLLSGSSQKLDFYYTFDLSAKGTGPRKAFFELVEYLPYYWGNKACIDAFTPMTSKPCTHKGLATGGYSADATASYTVENDPDKHQPGLVPDRKRSTFPNGDVSNSQFECGTETYSHVNRTTALETIDWFCRENAGHQFHSDGSEDVLFAWYYNLDFPADKHTPIGLGVYQPAGKPSPTCPTCPPSTCSYELDYGVCKGQLGLAMGACNSFGNNITLSGTIKDSNCDWFYEFDLHPGGAPVGTKDAAVIRTIGSS